MLYLLFFDRLLHGYSMPSTGDYLMAVIRYFKPVPFMSIYEYITEIKEMTLLDFAFRNLVGNTVLFIPLGIFLPAIFVSQRKFDKFMVTIVIIISCVEFLQAITLLGVCDVDDLILNAIGACIGFGLYALFRK